MPKTGWAKILSVLIPVLLFCGCGLKYTIRDPALSSISYAGKEQAAATTLTIIDQRAGKDAVFLMGKLGPGAAMSDISNLLKLENLENPIAYLAVNLEKELIQRGVAVKCAVGQAGGGGPELQVSRFQIANYRATGFSPWEACHLFAGVLTADGRSTPIKAFFYNGKTPVWSMDEISEPCFNVPASILVKDIASKINRAAFGMNAPDAVVDRLSAEIDAELPKKEAGGPFWKVLELGYTNNPKAMPALLRYADQGDEFFKSCALSAIGILGPEGQFEFLKKRFGNGGFNDRYMALKAIGDIGTAQAVEFVGEVRKGDLYGKEGGLKNCVDLYAP